MAKNISFISESVLEEKRKQRQEEWNKTRKEDDPIEAPEPEYDPRCLYERLKEQKLKKQEEYEESKKLKNLIKGLDNDEIEFLTICDNSKAELENQKFKEELLALEEYKRGVAHLNTEEQEQKLLEFKKELFRKHKTKENKLTKISNRKSQADLLLGAIKRKTKDEPSTDNKKIKNDNNVPGKTESISNFICRLPGIGCYDDGNSSNSSDSQSE